MAKKIEKSLSPEEMTIIGNVKSLIGELEQMSAGSSTVHEDEMDDADEIIDPIRKEEEDDDEEFDPESKVVKEDEEVEPDEDDMPANKARKSITTSTDTAGANASSDYEEMLADLPEEDADAIREILGKTKPNPTLIAKQLASAVTEMTKVVKSIHARQNATETALVSVLEGMGIAEQVTKDMEVRKAAESRKPVAQADVLAMLQDVLKSAKGSHPEVAPVLTPNEVRKGLADFSSAIFPTTGLVKKS